MNLPTKLTLMRIILIPVFLVLFFLPYPYLRFGAVAVFIIACYTDHLDGHLARKYNQITALGNFLDTTADKMLVACALVAISLDAHSFQIGVATCAMIIISRELFILGLRAVAASKNYVLAVDKLGKIKAVVQMIALILLLPYQNIFYLNELAGSIFLYVGLGLLALATVMTIIAGVNYLIKYKEVLKG